MIWVLALGRFGDLHEDTGGDGDANGDGVIKCPYENGNLGENKYNHGF